MSEPQKVRGMVLQASSCGEYDKRMVILTKERGKITAFARGARRQKSPLLAAANPFVFGVFTVYEGRDAYTLAQAEVSNYFMELKEDVVGTCGCYFMEVASYYTRENLDGAQLLNLLYASLLALSNEKLDNELVRCVFEMKAMALNGEYTLQRDRGCIAAGGDTLHRGLRAGGADPEALYVYSEAGNFPGTTYGAGPAEPDRNRPRLQVFADFEIYG